MALLQKMDSYARDKDPRVKQVSASIAGSWQAVQIIRPDGTLADIRPLVRLNVAVLPKRMAGWKAEAVNRRRFMFDPYLNPEMWEAEVDEALRIALLN